jgi:hypothetical protein
MTNADRNAVLKTRVGFIRGDGRNTCLYATVLTVVLGLELSPIKSLAVGCPNGPDHWFNVVVKIDPKSLPSGVRAESVIQYTGNTEIYLTNSTSIPLIINPPDPNKTYVEPYPRPLTMKLVSGEGYYCDVQSKPTKCKMNSNVNKGNASLDTPEIDKAVLAGWVTKDNRPKRVRIPNPESFQFKAMFGDKPIIIVGTVSFSLNNKYIPKLGAETKRMCDSTTHP